MDVTTATQVTTSVLTTGVLTTAIPAVASAPPAVALDIAKGVYIFCMISGLLWLLLTAFLGPLFGEFGGDHGGDIFDLQGEVHLSPMSPSVISAFIASFGCGGLVSMGVFDLTSLHALPIALGTGLMIGGFIYYLVRYVFLNVQGGVEAPVSDLIGSEAEVITGIPAGGLGEIAYLSSAGRQTSAARTEDGSAVAVRSIVEIVRVSGPHKVVRLKSAPPSPPPTVSADS
jgi:hypothetical protein